MCSLETVMGLKISRHTREKCLIQWRQDEIAIGQKWDNLGRISALRGAIWIH